VEALDRMKKDSGVHQIGASRLIRFNKPYGSSANSRMKGAGKG
jgi:hypothetical protein